MVELEFEVDDVHRVCSVPEGLLELAADEVGADPAAEFADGVHRRSMLRMAENLHFSLSSTSRIAEVRRRAET
jgi:hypothetical protein